ncbi:MAG TPA: helix-turn-helix domain-containing protein [Candidatus Thermoplasmatota archaeon]|nr:helix-turn-helix domain-containing protein [Candidatus Thermoplasmatota archaeon]
MQAEEGAELVERLVAIGLESREARLYVDLLLRGASRASDAAARTKLKRTETYRALEALMKRGFVTARLTRPVEYEASPPDAVFADLLARHEQQRSEMEALKARVCEVAYRARQKSDDDEARHGYRIIQGRRAIFSAAESVYRGARERLSVATAYLSPASAIASNRAYHALVRRAADGLAIDLLVRETPNFDRAFAPLLQQRNVRVRFADLPQGVRFLVADDREVIVWLVSDPAQGIDARDDIAMWTNAADFVRAQRAFFDALWPQGRDDLRVRTSS